MKKSNFALRLAPSLMEEARKLAKAEGIAVNQLINVAVAEKVSALRTEEYFAARAARGDVDKALGILRRAGAGKPPLSGDELPSETTSADVVSIDGMLRLAIANKRLIRIRYGGRFRIAEPHDYGVQKGVPRLLIFQRRGPGVRGGKSGRGWRLLDVAKIEVCQVLEGVFSAGRREPSPPHYEWGATYARVA